MRSLTAEPLGTIPLREVSGLAVGLGRRGRVTVAAVGDRTATVAVADVTGALGDLQWRTFDVATMSGNRLPRKNPQLEAIAVDGARGVLLVQEHPNHGQFVEADDRSVVAQVSLEVPGAAGSELRRQWEDPQGSHTEGAVLLRGGHLLVVMEKDPTVLLEFGPDGATPIGFGSAQWNPAGEPWLVDRGEITLVAVAAWYPQPEQTGLFPDLSDAARGVLGNLVLLSDQGSSVVVVPPHQPAAEPFAGTFRASDVWHLTGIAAKPEGVAVLPDGDVLVACDRRKVAENLFVVRRADWDRRDGRPAQPLA